MLLIIKIYKNLIIKEIILNYSNKKYLLSLIIILRPYILITTYLF